MQLDDNSRGFSYRVNTKLDLRFSSFGQSAEDIVNAASGEELERILSQYGEEPFSRLIARRIIAVRRASPVKSTLDLRLIVEDIVPKTQLMKSLSRVFQAFRIAVNDELNTLQNTLNSCLPCVTKGGRIVIISYHSLEDRIVKNFFRSNSKSTTIQTDNILSKKMPELKILTNKPIIPSDEEISMNPRARSAKLRAAEKL